MPVPVVASAAPPGLAAWRGAAWSGVLGVATLVAWTLLAGHTLGRAPADFVDPLAPVHSRNLMPWLACVRVPVLAAALWLWRALWRVRASRAQGGAAHLRLRRFGWLPWLTVEDRGSATPLARRAMAYAGLTALSWLPLLVALAALALPAWDMLRLLAPLLPVAVLLLLLDLAPGLPLDGAELLATATRVPDLRRRAMAFLLRRAVRNLRRGQALSPLERAYGRVATAWLLHGLLAIGLLGGVWIPAWLRFAVAAVRRDVPVWQWLLGAMPAVTGIAALAILLAALFWLAAAFARQSVVPLGSDRPQRAMALDAPAVADFTQSAAAIPFLARLGGAALDDLARHCRSEKHANLAVILRQGELGDRFCFLKSGKVRVSVEEESGLQHDLATLSPGDFFGEIALVADVPRTATVTADGPVQLYTLARRDFLGVVEAAGVTGEQVREQIRNAACLRGHPLFLALGAAAMRRLQDAIAVRHCAAQEEVVRQDETGDALYLIREGQFAVLRREQEGWRRVAELGAGDWFGEVALLGDGLRTATVTAVGAGTVLVVPGEVVGEVLLQDVSAATRLAQVAAERLASLGLQAIGLREAP